MTVAHPPILRVFKTPPLCSRWLHSLSALSPSSSSTRNSLPFPLLIPSLSTAEESEKMKGMKGRILKKLKSIPQVPYHLKQPPFLQSQSSDDLSDLSSPLESSRVLCDHRQESFGFNEYNRALGENKENVSPNSEKKPAQTESSGLSFRRPDPNSATLFDPDLLAAFQQAVMEHMRNLEEARIQEEEEEEEPPSKIPRTSYSSSDENNPVIEFEDKSPPGGRESIILYTTSIRGIRKTFDECTSIRLLLENLKLVFVERDLSMHIEFREELWRVLGFRAIPPRLFIKGRYIGGADEVLGLHEQGRLLAMVKGMPRTEPGQIACEACAGMRFVVCFECNGGRKVYGEEQGVNVQCRRCNENGLVVCSRCCCCCEK